MPNGDPRDGFFYPTLALTRDSYILFLYSTVLTYTDAIFTKLEVLRILEKLEKETRNPMRKKTRRGVPPVSKRDKIYMKKKKEEESE